ncbi:ABC transporter ATP-binding protein [Roseiarcaceae bacterium H3SJ34-1]|uniref:ABC transporter ATP-binding protein n=1 Tax=Terripilifer ovatus TaxID=3032367 RepID=UPI003AB95881|nr:ABC transporter ATP-binding protein [Roseiarcaceae bacterium H3SJ34-1]
MLAAEPAIACDGIVKVFGSGTDALTILRDASFVVRHQEFVSILGSSGSGKSTLFRFIAGLLKPTSGHIKILGREVEGPRDDVTLMFQNPTLFPWMSVLDNVLFPISYRFGRPTREQQAYARDLIATVGLAGKEKFSPSQLSGGMQQRVALARSLVRHPRIILLDEPFSALDEMLRENLAIDVHRILSKAECTVVLVTHSISEAVLLSDRVLILAGAPASITDVVAVDLPRPRTVATLDHPAYADACRTLRAAMRRNFQEAADV